MQEALDLCLACKGCKGDCPVNVDMATYKAEFLAHYYEGRLRPLHAYAFGLIDRWSRLASHAPATGQLITRMPGLRQGVKCAAGSRPSARCPPLPPRTFRWSNSQARRTTAGPRLLLWADTFNNYFIPQTLEAAVVVLERAGSAWWFPCATLLRAPALRLRHARHRQGICLRFCKRRAADCGGMPIVVLEPSCLLGFP